MSGTKSCIACAEEIREEAILCKHCHTSQDDPKFQTKHSDDAQAGLSIETEKSKSTAMLLAVFLGFWSFLYTYRADSRKFWFCLIPQSFITVFYITFFAWLGMNSYQLVVNQGISVSSLASQGNIVFLLLQAPTWIFAVVTQRSRSGEFFSLYREN